MSGIGRLATIQANDVTLDLSAHELRNERASGMTLVSHYKYFKYGHKQPFQFKRTRVRNGALNSIGGLGIVLVTPVDPSPRSVYLPDTGDRADSLSTGDGITAHVVENLTIRAGVAGIIIDGVDNVIRNNRIIVDGPVAIVAKGPGLILENNVIEVSDRLDRRAWPGARSGTTSPPRLPIHLIQADGAIVRNNRIEYVGVWPWNRPAAGIDLIESRDVTLEGNTSTTLESIVRRDARSGLRDAAPRPPPRDP